MKLVLKERRGNAGAVVAIVNKTMPPNRFQNRYIKK